MTTPSHLEFSSDSGGISSYPGTGVEVIVVVVAVIILISILAPLTARTGGYRPNRRCEFYCESYVIHPEKVDGSTSRTRLMWAISYIASGRLINSMDPVRRCSEKHYYGM